MGTKLESYAADVADLLCLHVNVGDTDDGIVTRSVMYLFDQMQKANSGCKYTFRSATATAKRASLHVSCIHVSHSLLSMFPITVGVCHPYLNVNSNAVHARHPSHAVRTHAITLSVTFYHSRILSPRQLI